MKRSDHPARRVACPTCKAPAGAPCKRPSGHAVFGGDVHAERREAALREITFEAIEGATVTLIGSEVVITLKSISATRATQLYDVVASGIKARRLVIDLPVGGRLVKGAAR